MTSDPIEERDVEKLLAMLDNEKIHAKIFNLGFSLREDYCLLPFLHQHEWEDRINYLACKQCDAYKTKKEEAQ